MITKYGYFRDYNKLYCDADEVLTVYPYKIDYPKIAHKRGYFLLRPSTIDEDGYVIVNFLLDEEQ